MDQQDQPDFTVGPSKEQFKDWMAMWHVEIEERPRHLWPDKWVITGWYAYEKHLYQNAEYKWDQEEQELWKEKHGTIEPTDDIDAIQHLLESSLDFGEDYFHWHVEGFSWSLHKDGVWRKLLISDDGYTGIYDSYEEAVATLGKFTELPPRCEDYEEHLAKESWHL